MKRAVLSVWGIFMMASMAMAAHPLVTDDTGTQGKGKGQAEIGASFFYDKESAGNAMTVKTEGGDATMAVTMGVSDSLDIIMCIPYAWHTLYENETRAAHADGISDVGFEAKWRFFEKDGWSLGLKPGISLPTGNEDKGLGAGRAAYRIFLIGTKKLEPAAFHLNLGYLRNENSMDQRRDLWHVSAAAEVEVIKDLKTLADIGIETNANKSSQNHPAFVLWGLAYDISEKITIDAGFKYGLTSSETDWTILTGLTIRF